MQGVDRDRRGRRRLLAVLLLVAITTSWVAMFAMHVTPSAGHLATAQMAAMPVEAQAVPVSATGAGSRVEVAGADSPSIGPALMPCRSFTMPCTGPSVPWHLLKAALLLVFLSAVVLLPIRSARLVWRVRFALPPPSLTVLSISRT